MHDQPGGRPGLALGLLQAQALMHSLAEHDPESAALEFDSWCTEHIRPWFEDHVRWDAHDRRRFLGEPFELDRPLPSVLVLDAVDEIPEMAPVAAQVMAMFAPPTALRPFEPRVLELVRGGWRPRTEPGPTRDELADHIAAVPV
jgi:hypothetical protein